MKKLVLISVMAVAIFGGAPAAQAGWPGPIGTAMSLLSPMEWANHAINGTLTKNHAKKHPRYSASPRRMAIAPASTASLSKPKAPRHTHRQYD